MTLASLKNYIEPLLCTSGLVRDEEEVVGLDFTEVGQMPETFWVTVKIKKHQEIEVFKH